MLSVLWFCLMINPASIPATTLLSVSNGTAGGTGLPIRHATVDPGSNNVYLAVQWTQTVPASNAQIRAAIWAPAEWTLEAYITTEIGMLAAIDDVAASTTVNVHTPGTYTIDNPPMAMLFAGFDLSPGTFYLVLGTSAHSGTLLNPLSWSGDSYLDAVYTNAPGFSFGPGYRYADDRAPRAQRAEEGPMCVTACALADGSAARLHGGSRMS